MRLCNEFNEAAFLYVRNGPHTLFSTGEIPMRNEDDKKRYRRIFFIPMSFHLVLFV